MVKFSIPAALASLSVSYVVASPQGPGDAGGGGGIGGGGGGAGGGFVPLIDKHYTWDNLVSLRLPLTLLA